VDTTATFRLFGNATRTAAEVSRRLGVRPTRTVESGDGSLWLLSSSPRSEPGTELAEHLHRLLTILEPVAPALWGLVHAGYQANWFGHVASHATEHAAELGRPTLRRLLALPGDLWLDVCGDDAD
jgi:hypothetical protein